MNTEAHFSYINRDETKKLYPSTH